MSELTDPTPRRLITEPIGDPMEFDTQVYGDNHIPIDYVIKILDAIKTLGATHIEFSGGGGENGAELIEMKTVMIYTESQAQAQARIREEVEEKARIDSINNMRSKAEYERLKKIWGKVM